MATIDELSSMKKKLDEKRTRKSQLDGQRSQQMSTLKSLGFSTLPAAEKELKIMSTTVDKLDAEIDEAITQLHEKYQL